jgi:hypothetical protein
MSMRHMIAEEAEQVIAKARAKVKQLNGEDWSVGAVAGGPGGGAVATHGPLPRRTGSR